jgi:SAM-dependent methyltransferase
MTDKTKTGWERENRVHFDEIAENYDKARWDYPGELFADIFDYLGTGHKTALEIGAGTGKATAPFIDAGYDVTAVEMGANMTEFILEKFKGQKNFKAITATFEDKEVILKHGGQLKKDYIFQLYMGRKP